VVWEGRGRETAPYPDLAWGPIHLRAPGRCTAFLLAVNGICPRYPKLPRSNHGRYSSKPELEDPLHEREIFANEISGIAMVHGNFIVTLAKLRFEEAAEGQAAKVRRIVSGRVVLTNVAANQLLQHLQSIAAQIEAAAALAAGHKPN
jgi:hypothetical protein